MKETFNMARNREKARKPIRMVLSTLVIGKMTCLMELDLIPMSNEAKRLEPTTESGETVKSKEKGGKNLKTVLFMKENGIITNPTGLESLNTRMETCTKGTGGIQLFMEKARRLLQMAQL